MKLNNTYDFFLQIPAANAKQNLCTFCEKLLKGNFYELMLHSFEFLIKN